MKKLLIIIFVSLFIISCKNNEEKIVYFPNGKVYKIEEYTINKKLKYSKKYDTDNNLISVLVLNDKNKYKESNYIKGHIIYGYGKLDSLNRKIGWWTFFDEKNKLTGKQEYITVNHKEFVNQGYSYNTNGTIDFEHTRYVNLEFKESEKSKCYIGVLKYKQQLGKKSIVLVCISSNLNKDFSNIDKIRLDTIGFKNSKSREFPLLFETPGKKNIRGFVLERIPLNWNDTLKKEPMKFIENYCYFEKTIFVK